MTNERQSGRSLIGTGSRPIALGKHASDHILIDADSERFVDLLRDSSAAKPCISAFHFNDGVYQLL